MARIFRYYNDGIKPSLAPAYDLLSTAIYPDIANNMAMKIGGQYDPKYVCRRDFNQLVPDTKTARSSINQSIKTIFDKINSCIEKTKEELKSEGIVSDAFDDIIKVIRQRCERLKE